MYPRYLYVCTYVCLFTLQTISISIITESSILISVKRFPRSFKCASTLVQFLQFFVASVQAFVLSSAHQCIVAGRGRRGFYILPVFYVSTYQPISRPPILAPLSSPLNSVVVLSPLAIQFLFYEIWTVFASLDCCCSTKMSLAAVVVVQKIDHFPIDQQVVRSVHNLWVAPLIL